MPSVHIPAKQHGYPMTKPMLVPLTSAVIRNAVTVSAVMPSEMSVAN
jgi:hypothetical protein